MRISTAFVLAVVVTSGIDQARSADRSTCPTPQGERIQVARGDAGSPVVSGSVNGRGPLFFILDTGASGTTLRPKTVAEFNLPRDAANDQGQGIGDAVEVALHRVRTIDIGPLNLRDIVVPAVPAPVFDSHDIVGLAGVDLFVDRMAIWNLSKMEVIVRGSIDLTAERCWHRTPSTWLRPWKVMIPISIAGHVGQAMIDTGLQHTTMNRAFAALARPTEQVPAGEMSGVDGSLIPVMRGHVRSIVLGPLAWSSRTVQIADLPLFQRLGDPAAPTLVLGIDWLEGQTFAIDYKTQTAWFASAR